MARSDNILNIAESGVKRVRHPDGKEVEYQPLNQMLEAASSMDKREAVKKPRLLAWRREYDPFS